MKILLAVAGIAFAVLMAWVLRKLWELWDSFCGWLLEVFRLPTEEEMWRYIEETDEDC